MERPAKRQLNIRQALRAQLAKCLKRSRDSIPEGCATENEEQVATEEALADDSNAALLRQADS
jgi:hypothetical protein